MRVTSKGQVTIPQTSSATGPGHRAPARRSNSWRRGCRRGTRSSGFQRKNQGRVGPRPCVGGSTAQPNGPWKPARSRAGMTTDEYMEWLRGPRLKTSTLIDTKHPDGCVGTSLDAFSGLVEITNSSRAANGRGTGRERNRLVGISSDGRAFRAFLENSARMLSHPEGTSVVGGRICGWTGAMRVKPLPFRWRARARRFPIS